MRPLFWRHQNDPAAVAVEDQFDLGPSLLVAPVLRPGQTARMVYLPDGAWWDYWTGERFQGGRHIVVECGLERIPIFVPAGGIVPMCAPRQYIGERIISQIELHVWPGAPGQLRWVEDDDHSLDAERGVLLRRTITYEPSREGVGGRLKFGAAEGPWRSRIRTWRVKVHGMKAPVKVQRERAIWPSAWNRESGLLEFKCRNDCGEIEFIWK